MVAGCGAKIAKLLLFIINFCVWAVGIILIGVGAYALVEADKYSYLFGDSDTLTSVAAFMIAVGCIIFIVGFCGCCGAIKQSVCLLKIYFALILLVIVLEIVAAILAFVYKDSLTDVVTEEFQEAIKMKYTGETNNVPTETIDRVQEEFMCCGSNGTEDWAMSAWGMNYSELAAPASCCINPEEMGCNTGTPGMPDNADRMNMDGCVVAFTDWIKSNYLMVGGVCLGLLVFEILALVFTCCLINAVQKDDKGI